MGNIITIIICLVCIILLLRLLLQAIRAMILHFRVGFRAVAAEFRHPCAEEAYRILKRGAVNGRVSDETVMKAVELMASDGMTDEEIMYYLVHCDMQMDIDAARARSRIQKYRTRIADLEYADAIFDCSANRPLANDVHAQVALEKDMLEKKIECEQQEAGAHRF